LGIISNSGNVGAAYGLLKSGVMSELAGDVVFLAFHAEDM
jgi:hypothetical protein